MMSTSILWLFYDIAVGSIGGIANEFFVQITLIITIYRLAHVDGNKFYFSEKVSHILFKKRIFDYDRFVFLKDTKQKLTQQL